MPNDTPANTPVSLFVKQGQEPTGFGAIATDAQGNPVSAGQLVKMLSANGKETIDAAVSQVGDFLKQGYSKAIAMTHVPSGRIGWIPEARAAAAAKSGDFTYGHNQIAKK